MGIEGGRWFLHRLRDAGQVTATHTFRYWADRTGAYTTLQLLNHFDREEQHVCVCMRERLLKI